MALIARPANRYRRGAVLVALAALIAALLPALPAAAAPPESAPGFAILKSDQLVVKVDRSFPRVVTYRHAGTGAVMYGQDEEIDTVVLNGEKHHPTVTTSGIERTRDSARIGYVLTFPEVGGTVMKASLAVEGNVMTFSIDAIEEKGGFRVGSIDIPQQDLLSVRSTQPGATVAAADIDDNATRDGDTFTRVTEDLATDKQPRGSAYAIVNTDRLAAAIETNSVYDHAEGDEVNGNARIRRQATRDGGVAEVGLWSGQWTYRAEEAPYTEELPWAKVVITGDRNGDETVDWQDGAIAYREITVDPLGWKQTPSRVVQHIPFNIASQATHPFLRTLDDVKRIARSTDSLGQMVLLKGYQDEGHDTSHPDYGGHYNRRAGGLEALNKLLAAGEQWGADFGVHVNATESYPSAHNFSEKLVDKNAKGWDWLDQSYYIDQRWDLTSGDLRERFATLKKQTHENLDFLYIDVYYSGGWKADRTQEVLRQQGWQVANEWSDKLERSTLWSHWSADKDYGGDTSRGMNSQIIRFVRNHQKDVWLQHPLLGSATIKEFEGWTGEVDWTKFYRNIWSRNLPTKYLQHFRIMDWEQGDIRFTGGVRATNENGRRQFFAGGVKVLDGDTYLLPWKPGKADKLYHWNSDGGTTTWELPGSWSDRGSVKLYELTDQGRELAAELQVAGGKVSIDAEAGTAYVVYPDKAGAQPDARLGQGTPVDDPGFNSGDLDAWDVSGDSDAASVTRNDRGQYEAVLGSGGAAEISQELSGLTSGQTYAATVQVEVEHGQQRKATISVTPEGAETVSNHVRRSTVKNGMASDAKHGTYFHRMRVLFDVPQGSDSATLALGAVAGDARVKFDNIRVVETERSAKDGAMVYENFEHVTQGWHPFVYAGPVVDPRTHITEKHAPYTQRGWNGKLVDDVLAGAESLKSHEERDGLIYRTVPQTVRFEAGHRYRVEFTYASGHAGEYEWVRGYDTGRGKRVIADRMPIGQQRTPDTFSHEFVAGTCGTSWVGLNSLPGSKQQADFVIDNFTVVDLGPARGLPACATVDVESSSETLRPGHQNKVSATFTNHGRKPATDLELDMRVPQGWQASPDSRTSFDSVGPGNSVTATWQVTPPSDAKYQQYELTAAASYTAGEQQQDVAGATTVQTLPPPPTGDVSASDIPWVSADNGWGPVERDTSNGGNGPDDGNTITLNGTEYEKGLGVHAKSEVRYYLDGQCSSFTAKVGLDDEQPTRGSVVFKVLADGQVVYESPVMEPDSATETVKADIAGATYVDLVVTNSGDGNGNDHGDWAAAQFHCDA